MPPKKKQPLPKREQKYMVKKASAESHFSLPGLFKLSTTLPEKMAHVPAEKMAYVSFKQPKEQPRATLPPLLKISFPTSLTLPAPLPTSNPYSKFAQSNSKLLQPDSGDRSAAPLKRGFSLANPIAAVKTLFTRNKRAKKTGCSTPL